MRTLHGKNIKLAGFASSKIEPSRCEAKRRAVGKGTPNKATSEAREACAELVDDPTYRATLRDRLLAGQLAPAVEPCCALRQRQAGRRGAARQPDSGYFGDRGQEALVGSGKIVKRDDHLMDAARYLVVSGRELMRTKPKPAIYDDWPTEYSPTAWIG